MIVKLADGVLLVPQYGEGPHGELLDGGAEIPPGDARYEEYEAEWRRLVAIYGPERYRYYASRCAPGCALAALE